ncbi:MAG: valine--tRNA ligase [Halobacteriovorax sp.]|nr:valine--tRNA ligase [Halobacteriovorax sp.]|tara:strand:+ start:59904 stop:62558 length:2655 start_codon:yes stop_codon:yes gene_type:complete
MSDISKTYSPEDVEKKWYKTWEEGKYFKPRPGKQNQGYCIIMPPPNVTGRLHAGHALDITTQDALIRFKRMKGFEALWLPGMDHAGIATQTKVEELIFEEEGKKRGEYSREYFLEKTWKWVEDYGGIIALQSKTMGASPDWDYSMFTMDEGPHQAVKKAFVDLYNEGLIYQSDYIVNWDPGLQSAISDAEVEYQEVNGNFYHLNYQVKGSDELIEIATTRPETLLGDTAVSVHPEDERFKHLIGKTAIVPLCNREVPILGDNYVDMEKGTGCLKVTPGHDFNDFEIGKRHNLPIINILNKDGTLNDYGLEWKNLSCKDARKAIVKKLKELEVLIDVKPHRHQVGHGDRSKTIIEPMVSKQWFLNTKEMAKDSVEAVESDTTKFYPKGWENTYFSYQRNPRDWCISRQLWWGHQIPVFKCDSCHHQWASEEESPSSCEKCNEKELTQDPDVLDTWFSSGLWPFSTLGWPNKEKMIERKFDTFYPTSVLVTGHDIIFFWVARMMMMGQKFTGTVPFHKIYIHAIVRDKLGRKMSKSLNNGIDPLDMVKQYGADAFRFTLAAGSGYNRGINLDPERIGGFRNFVNKIWNAYRFIEPHLANAGKVLPKDLDHHERWIIGELNAVSKVMNESMEEFRYDDSCSAIYQFVYDKFCSWFIELSKTQLNGDDTVVKAQRATVLRYVFRKIVALLHPMTPFITEELWSFLKDEDEELLIIQDYPEFSKENEHLKDQDIMNRFIETVTGIRNLRASVNIKPKEEVPVELFTDDDELLKYYSENLQNFTDLAKVGSLKVSSKTDKRPGKSVFKATTHTEIFLPLEGVIDLTEQISRLEKDLKKTEKEFLKYDKKLNNEKFMNNAPDDVKAEVRENAKEFEEKLKSIKENLKNFKS